MADREPLLDLSTIITRQTIRIDGASYELVNADEVSVLEEYRLRTQGKRLDALMEKTELTEDEQKELASLPGAICRKILLAPDDVQRKLTDAQRSAVMKAFSKPQRSTADTARLAAIETALKTADPAMPLGDFLAQVEATAKANSATPTGAN